MMISYLINDIVLPMCGPEEKSGTQEEQNDSEQRMHTSSKESVTGRPFPTPRAIYGKIAFGGYAAVIGVLQHRQVS